MSRSAATARLAVLLVVMLGLGALAASLAPKDLRETVLDHSRDVILGHGGDDSWGVMHIALERFRAAPDTLLYTEVFFLEKQRFQYPPSSLFALKALRLAGPERVRIAEGSEFGIWPPINEILGWIFIALTAVASAALLEAALRSPPGLRTALRMILVAAITITCYPIVKAFTLGQIQVWINALFAIVLLAWMHDRRALAGLLIGLVCLIKPHYGLLLLWALFRREWRFLIAATLTVAAGAVAALAVFGWHNHVDYLRVLQFLSQRGEAYYPNQSVNGLLNRLMGIGDPGAYVILDIPPGKFPPFTPIVYWPSLASSVALVVYGLWRRSPPAARTRDLARMTLCCTIASPIAWEHHYGILLPIVMLLMAERDADYRRIVALIAAAAVAFGTFPVANLLAATAFNPLMSYLLFAALGILALLHRDRLPEGDPSMAAIVGDGAGRDADGVRRRRGDHLADAQQQDQLAQRDRGPHGDHHAEQIDDDEVADLLGQAAVRAGKHPCPVHDEAADHADRRRQRDRDRIGSHQVDRKANQPVHERRKAAGHQEPDPRILTEAQVQVTKLTDGRHDQALWVILRRCRLRNNRRARKFGVLEQT